MEAVGFNTYFVTKPYMTREEEREECKGVSEEGVKGVGG